MIKKLLMEAFEKAQEETNNNTPNGQAKHIAKLMSEKYNSPITQKSMMRYYDGESTPKMELQNGLAKYLGYSNYEDFVRDNKKSNNTFKIIIAIIFSGGIVFGFIYFFLYWKPKKCMIWEEDRYEKVACEEINEPQIALNPNLLENFQLVKLDTIEVYFKNGKPLYWYDKDEGEVEFFNMPGNHPTNGKKLKPITERIIRTYLDKEE